MSSLSIGLTSNRQIGGIARFFRTTRLRVPLPARGAEAPASAVSIDGHIDRLESSLRAHHRLGAIILISALLIVGGWAGVMPLAGAVVVGGTFVVHSSAKKIQHKTGGVVREIAVHDGSKVKAGDPLIILDDTDVRAEVAALARQMDETQLRIARLTAERDKAAAIAFGAGRYLLSGDDHRKMIKSEADFFRARQASQQSVQRLADARIAQLEKQLAGLGAQLRTNKRQQEITGAELSGMEELRKKKIAPIQRLTPLQREMARLEGGDSVIEASKQEIANKIAEIRLEAQQSAQSFRAEVLRDLNEASAASGQLLEKLIVANQALDRARIAAPVSGVVNELAVHTIGGVVSPAETLMTIVPEDDRLEIAVRLAPDKIDQVRIHRRARVRLTAFERTTPDIEGAVSFVSPDLVESKGGAYYDVRIAVDQHPRGLSLSPGMPAEVFIEADKRTMLSYLTKPLTEHWARMFVER